MESSSLEEENIIKVVRNVFTLKKKIDDTTIKGKRNFFRLEKEIKVMKYRIIRDIKDLFQHEEKDYYKPVKVGNFWSKSYIEYESKGDRKGLSVDEYLNEIKPYLKDIIKNLARGKFI